MRGGALALALEVRGGETRTLTESDFLALPEQTSDGGGGKARSASAGWLLRDVIARATVARLKRNLRGLLVATIWDMSAERAAQVAQVRDLRRIVLIPR